MNSKEQAKRLLKLSEKTGCLTFAEVAKGLELLCKITPSAKEAMENLNKAINENTESKKKK